MKLILKTVLTASVALCATAAASADYQVKRTLEISSPATEAWNQIGDFCDIDDWHPGVNACSLKVVDGSLTRVLTTNDGAEIVHKRIAEEPGLSYTYKTVSSSMPIEKFTATVSIEPFDRPLIMWIARFSSEDPAMEQVIVDEMEAGIAAMNNMLNAQ